MSSLVRVNDKKCINCYHAHYDATDARWYCIYKSFRWHWRVIKDPYRQTCSHYKKMRGLDL